MIARSSLLLGYLILTMAWCALEAKIDQTIEEQINSGLNLGEKIADGLSKFGNTESSLGKLFGSLDKMAGFLGAAGGLISFALAFLPKQESAELKYMKEQFSKVNMKLDGITHDLENVKDLITLENQRSQYIAAANKILLGFNQMNRFLTEISSLSCSTENDCRRQRLEAAESYVKHLDVKQQLHDVLRGSVAPVSIFGDPLLDLIKTTYKCDIAKVDTFANGVLKLAFKGQQVLLTHDKLTGTKTSILASMDDWLQMVYALRRKTNQVRNECFRDITTFMLEDIKLTKYQVNYDDNQGAADAVKRELSAKYPWVHWVVVSYNAYGGDNHWTSNKEGAFWNMPAAKEDRKRNIIVTPQSKGEYLQQRGNFAEKLEALVAKGLAVNRFSTDFPADKLHKALETELKKQGVWHLLKSFTVLKKYDNLKTAIDADHQLFWYNEELSITLKRRNHFFNTESTKSVSFRVIAILKSIEELTSVVCKKTCNGHGRCKMLPYSTKSYCECADYYQGENCKYHVKSKLALNMEKMLAVTFRIPKLTEVYFEIRDLSSNLGSNIGNIADVLSTLGRRIQQSFDELNEKLTSEFRWVNLLTMYSGTITDLIYSMNHPPKLVDDDESCANNLATNLAPQVRRWLDDVNHLIVGRTDVLLQHKSIILTMIDRHKAQACTTEYKDAIDSTWKQLMLLQFQANSLLAQLEELRGQSSSKVLESYQRKIDEQKRFLSSQTCQVDVPSSINVHCNNGFYLYPGLNLDNKCPINYFVSGSLVAKCPENKSGCKPCNCNSVGSVDGECKDLSGQCTCKNTYYGTRCENRHCRYGSWQGWANCPGCEVGSETRTRSIVKTTQGSGSHCSGPSSESRPCFRGCCSGHFQCGSRSCLTDTKRCDYFNDCNGVDENNCNDHCQTRYTNKNSDGGGDMVYLDRHEVNCGGAPNVMQKFHLQRFGGDVRYQFTCCTLLKDVCNYPNHWLTTAFSDDGGGNLVFLDRHRVDCGHTGIINEFFLERNGAHNQVRYRYRCCKLRSNYHSKVHCYDGQTSLTDDGGGDVFYLDRQTVQCRSKYYLSMFKLQRNSNHDRVQYVYKCCTINV